MCVLRNCLFLIVTTISLFSFSQNDYEQIIKNEKKKIDSKLLFKKSILTESYNIVYHRLEFDLKLDNNYLYGKITTYFNPLKPAFNIIQFDAEDYLKIDSVIYKNEKMSFIHSNKQLTISLSKNIEIGTLDSLSVYYQGNPGLNNPYKSFVFDMHNANDLHPVAWTLSEPYGSKGWWICKESLSDKIDSTDILIKVKKGNTAVSNGLLVFEKSINDSQVLFHWKHRYPIATYLIAIAATNYIRYSDNVIYNVNDTLPIENFVYPESENEARIKTPQTIKMIKLYDSLFGVFPFKKEKYGHAQFGISGGMEHQTISFMGSFNFDLTAHELAHQWFGDATTCGSWSELWLNEGFATYLNMLCYENFVSGKEFTSKMENLNADITKVSDGSVYIGDTANTSRLFSGRLTYSKGAFLLHMLRWKIGDNAFFGGVKNYLQNPKCKYGFGTTQLLKNELENSSGKNLDEFFKDWYTGEGFPQFDISWGNKGNKIWIRINQTPSHHSVQFFNIPLPFLIKGISKDTILVFDPISKDNTFTETLDFLPEEIIFDPQKWILSKSFISKITDQTLPEVSIYPNPAYDFLNLYCYKSQILKIEVIDFSGKTVYKNDYESDKIIKNHNSIDISKFCEGIYIAKVQTSNGNVPIKFIKK
ncbi:MAG: T9SS type A sorting domain-containing protein [Bacteroidia bacterium]|nr:T9SS type A sorting domain-containing protein [Bacteroidia bacterium]